MLYISLYFRFEFLKKIHKKSKYEFTVQWGEELIKLVPDQSDVRNKILFILTDWY